MNRKPTLLFILLVLSILLNGCYARKTITYSHRAVERKKSVLLHHDQELWEIRDFRFTEDKLEGRFSKLVIPPVPRLMKLSMLDVYVDPDHIVEIDTTHSDIVTLPYNSILKIEKTRLRVEYLIIVPVLYGLFVANFTVGSSF